VPVSPDWRDPSGLIGYFNALHADPTYQAEPALRLICGRIATPLPYFLILDEMNLARIEHYFAPFLSAMETGDAAGAARQRFARERCHRRSSGRATCSSAAR
jgi:5-methylcytosine-specific restriction protein B